jgi:hypothetical protein
LQIETGAIGIIAVHRGPFNFQGIEPIDELRHPSAALQLPTSLPTRLVEIVLDNHGGLKTEEA